MSTVGVVSTVSTVSVECTVNVESTVKNVECIVIALCIVIVLCIVNVKSTVNVVCSVSDVGIINRLDAGVARAGGVEADISRAMGSGLKHQRLLQIVDAPDQIAAGVVRKTRVRAKKCDAKCYR